MMNKDGILLRGVGGLYTVRTDDGDTVTCRAKGSLRQDGKAVIGDRVRLETGDTPDSTVIAEIYPRKNCLIRPPVSNMDVVAVVASVKHPVPVPETLDKMTAILTYHGIQPVLVFTKNDVSPAEGERLSGLYRRSGFSAFAVSSLTGEGIIALRELLTAYLEKGATVALAGASGAGKSTLINTLFPSFSLATGEISARIERGKHTTRTVELFPLLSGYLADTPGFSLLDFTRFDFFPQDELVRTFPEFLPYLGECQYADCTHTKEESCAIRRALTCGEISESRYASFLSIREAMRLKNPYAK